MRAAPHTLDAKGEEIVAQFGLATNAGGDVYTMLSNADLPWPTVKLSDGTEVKLDQAAYTKYRAVGNREDRKKVFDAFWGKWKEFERTFGVTFYEQLKKEAVYTKVRNYPDSLSRALDGNDIPPAVYNMLIDQTRANLPTLHRYFKLRAKLLGIGDLHYYDMYPPLLTSDLKYPVAEGKQLMLDAVKPLGPDYVAAMSDALQHRWMDVYPRPHKLSGAYMNGIAYDVHPYLLLNYNDDYESVSTLAHEWGHAMHSYLANHAQPFVTTDYPIFTAEIASTTNERCLLDRMLKIAKTDDEAPCSISARRWKSAHHLLRRGGDFADFEREVHAKVDERRSLTGEDLTQDLRRHPAPLSRRQGRAWSDKRLRTQSNGQISAAFLRPVLRLPVRLLDLRRLNVRRLDPERRTAAQSVYLNILRAGGSIRQIWSGSRHRPGYARAVSGGVCAHEQDHG